MTDDDRRYELMAWAFTWAALFWADAIVTIWWALGHGAVELNPVAVSLFNSMTLWGLLVLKAAVTSIMFLLLWGLRISRSLPVVQGLTLLYVLIVLWNATQIWMMT